MHPHFLQNPASSEPTILENSVKLSAADILVYTYDSSDPDHFAYITQRRSQRTHLEELPPSQAALEADRDKLRRKSDGNYEQLGYSEATAY